MIWSLKWSFSHMIFLGTSVFSSYCLRASNWDYKPPAFWRMILLYQVEMEQMSLHSFHMMMILALLAHLSYSHSKLGGSVLSFLLILYFIKKHEWTLTLLPNACWKLYMLSWWMSNLKKYSFVCFRLKFWKIFFSIVIHITKTSKYMEIFDFWFLSLLQFI